MYISKNDIVYLYHHAKFQYTFKDGEVVYGEIIVINDPFIIGKLLEPKPKSEYEDFELDDFRRQGDLKLILHHQSEMTVHQKREYFKLCTVIWDSNKKRIIVDTPQSLLYLFTHNIDAFSLIDKGEALSANWYYNKDLIPKKQIEKELIQEEECTGEEFLTVIPADNQPYSFYIHPEDKIK